MRAVIKVLALVAMVGFIAAGCRSMTGESAGQNVDDTKLTTEVKAKLTADKTSNLTRVGVNTVQGTVYLTGVVDTPQHKARAAEIAAETKGVRQVVNNLQVSQSPAASPAPTIQTPPPSR